MKYEVHTTVHGSLIGVQLIQVQRDLIEEIRTTISRQVIDTQETTVRQALVLLGWTPPPGPASQ